MSEEEKALLTALSEAIERGDSKTVTELKYKCLFYGANLLDVLVNFIVLHDCGVDFDFGHSTIKRGTKLYRIRRFDEKTDFSNPDQWSYPPSMPENRANREGEPALYLGTTEMVCLTETHIGYGEKYALGEYEVTEDIRVGGFFGCEDLGNMSWFLAGVILNAFLIAPARSEKNTELFDFLDTYYKGLTIEDLQINIATKMDLPLKFGVINKKEEYYPV